MVPSCWDWSGRWRKNKSSVFPYVLYCTPYGRIVLLEKSIIFFRISECLDQEREIVS
jgi:hypothetical protein